MNRSSGMEWSDSGAMNNYKLRIKNYKLKTGGKKKYKTAVKEWNRADEWMKLMAKALSNETNVKSF